MNKNFIKVSKKLIFKKVLLFLCIFSLMISISVLGADFKLRVITKRANVRLKPSLSSDILSQVPFGAILESQGKFGNWYKVNLPADESGFVVSGYIYESIVEEVIQKFKEPTIKEETPQEVAQPITQRSVNWQQKAIANAKKDGKRDAPGIVFALYGCVAPIISPIVIGSGRVFKPSPPPTAIVGKSPEYVALYTETYQRSMQKAAAKKAWMGSIVGCVGYAGLGLLPLIVAK